MAFENPRKEMGTRLAGSLEDTLTSAFCRLHPFVFFYGYFTAFAVNEFPGMVAQGAQEKRPLPGGYNTQHGQIGSPPLAVVIRDATVMFRRLHRDFES